MEDHPEWFADIGGKKADYIRFNAPGVKERVIKDIEHYFETGGDYFVLLQNDGFMMDNGAITQSSIDLSRGYYGFFSEIVSKAFIEIAGDIYKRYPEKTVVIGAYHCYARPPKGVKKLPPNAAVCLARHRLNNVFPEGLRDNQMLIDEWMALKPKELYIWEYYCYGSPQWSRIRYELWPRYIPHTIEKDICRLADIRRKNSAFKGEWLFLDSRRDDANSWWLIPDAYITERLFWDPYQSIDALLDDFYTKAFGAGASDMKKFYSVCEDVWTKGAPSVLEEHPYPVVNQENEEIKHPKALGFHFMDRHLKPSAYKKVWTPEVLRMLDSLLKNAEAAAKNSPDACRIAFVRDGFDMFRNGGGRLLETDTFSAVFDNGMLMSYTEKKNGIELMPEDRFAPIMRIRMNGRDVMPCRMRSTKDKQIFDLQFRAWDSPAPVDVRLKISSAHSALVFEVVSLEAHGNKIERILWGNFYMNLCERGPRHTFVGYKDTLAAGLLPLSSNTHTGIVLKDNTTSPWSKKGFFKAGREGYLAAWSSVLPNNTYAGSRAALFVCPFDKIADITKELSGE
jgi:hypothetical protein